MTAQPQEEPVKYRWRIPAVDLAARKALREALGISRICAQVLLNRRIERVADARRFLAPEGGTPTDPHAFRDMGRAVARIERALAGGERITVYGDYDVDGVSATALLGEFFAGLGYRADLFIPDRFADGYGLCAAQVERLAEAGTTLIITCDNGTSSHGAVARAAELGVDVIVTDHHEVRGALPAAFAILNPHRPDDTYPDKRLCGVGVALKLCHGILIGRGEATADALPETLFSLLDLVALGTIADVAPLSGENRMLVRAGLKLLGAEARPGIAALKEVAGLAGQEVGAGQVGFHLGPRINAGGRMGSAAGGVTLLTTRDRGEATEAARYLDAANRERRTVEAAIQEEVEARIADGGLAARHCIVLASADWHGGVLGIIASRVVERHHRPCLLIAVDSATGIGKGSGRSIPKVDLFSMLCGCEDLLLGFGGHMYAAGVTVEAGQVEALGDRLDGLVAREMTPDMFRPELKLDASARLSEVGRGLVDELARAAPFGSGNPEPVLMLPGVVPKGVRVVGEHHLKMTLTSPEAPAMSLPAIAFGCADWLDGPLAEGRPVDLAGNLSLNRWQGRETVQLRVRDLRPVSGTVRQAGLQSE